ncbi:MAG: exosome complex RNA-binding protein Csl4 [Candidatus Verstraetearchaeota archaeon]|jgi:exosome complex component CSL4|nr:exosome complex RNA-binding protein Csl4 [Candidatus Verstraetearchaeota archaeon]
MKTRIVVPGEEIGVEEEYIPGKGVYVDKGKIFSLNLGNLIVDEKEKKICVEPISRLIIPERGDIIEGMITGFVKDDFATVEIMRIRNKGDLKRPMSGILHISQISGRTISSIFDLIGIGDWILAKVLTSWPPYQLSIIEKDFGVIYATCPKCGYELILKQGKLYCSKDKIFVKKKISPHYLIREEGK